MSSGRKREKRPRADVEDRGRQPRSSLHREEARTPRALPPNPRARNPVWAFRVVDIGGPWCWRGIDGDGLVDVLQKLRSFESMTWEQIDGPSGSHGVAAARLCKRARDRLVDIRQDDTDEVFSLRITGRRRIWGILDEHVLRILWWDPEHEVCPSLRKHT